MRHGRCQRTLLPQAAPSLPGLDLAASMDPAEEVGGDSFDFISLEGDRLAVCLADVSGKGLPASLLMANLQAAVRSQSMTTLSPTECLSRTNGLLYHSTAPEKFATAFYGIIDPVGDTLSFCNAGHESPYLLGPDGSQRQLSTGGIMLGVVDGFPFNEETVPFPPGSTLVVFSDGVTEATDEEGTMFGADRVREVVARLSALPAESIRIGLLKELREFVGSARPSDDITVLVAKRSAQPTTS